MAQDDRSEIVLRVAPRGDTFTSMGTWDGTCTTTLGPEISYVVQMGKWEKASPFHRMAADSGLVVVLKGNVENGSDSWSKPR